MANGSAKKAAASPSGDGVDAVITASDVTSTPSGANADVAPDVSAGDEGHAAPADGPEAVEAVDPDENLKKDLQQQAEDRGLDTSGTKQELADRINEHDQKGAHVPDTQGPIVNVES